MTLPDTAMTRAALVSELFAVAPRALGGVVLRGRFGPSRDRVCGWLGQLGIAPVTRLPLHVTEDRLLGGLSLGATLREGRPVVERGLLAGAHGGVVVAASAERLTAAVTVQLCAALDRGELAVERDSISGVASCKIGLVALDEGVDEERAPAALRDRLAFEIDMDALVTEGALHDDAEPDAARVARAVVLLERVSIDGEALAALCQAATALGVASPRAALQAAHTARAHAALSGRTSVIDEDLVVSAALVLGHRATRAPSEASDGEPEAAPPQDEGDDENAEAAPEQLDASDADSDARSVSLDAIVLKAAKSGIPAGLLDVIALGRPPQGALHGGRSGVARASTAGGRPAGVRRGVPQPGERLNVVETLRAAAPWQRLRAATAAHGSNRIHVRKEDFRVNRFQQRTETCVVFCVDASGSAALQRLAEAKGAIEQVLRDCYSRRDHVALVAFRGTTAEVVLAPTRSLTRVRRGLADLAGGGGTPLAAGIASALAIAVDARRKGRTPVVVLMTDGRANVGREGSEGAPALADAMTAAREVRATGIPVLFLDTSPRPRAQARDLARELGAVYKPLPYLEAPAISREVAALAGRLS